MSNHWIWGGNRATLLKDFNYSEKQLTDLNACFTSLQDANGFVSWLKEQVKGVPPTVTGGFSIINHKGESEWVNRLRHAQDWKKLSMLRE